MRHVIADRTRAHLVAGGMVGSMRRAGTRVTCTVVSVTLTTIVRMGGGVRFEASPIFTSPVEEERAVGRGRHQEEHRVVAELVTEPVRRMVAAHTTVSVRSEPRQGSACPGAGC